MPSFIELIGYAFKFQTILIGPFWFYNDYNDFIAGLNLNENQVVSVNWIFLEIIWKKNKNCRLFLKKKALKKISQPDNRVSSCFFIDFSRTL